MYTPSWAIAAHLEWCDTRPSDEQNDYEVLRYRCGHVGSLSFGRDAAGSPTHDVGADWYRRERGEDCLACRFPQAAMPHSGPRPLMALSAAALARVAPPMDVTAAVTLVYRPALDGFEVTLVQAAASPDEPPLGARSSWACPEHGRLWEADTVVARVRTPEWTPGLPIPRWRVCRACRDAGTAAVAVERYS